MKIKLKLLFFLAPALILSCSSKGSDFEELVASFEYEPEEIIVGEKINFNNSSKGIKDQSTEIRWDFGDQTYSTQKSPSHIYTAVGKYRVQLSLIEDGLVETLEKELVVSLPSHIEGRKTLIQKLEESKILVCAHRAKNNHYPENSLAAIKQAIEEGLDMIEIDLRETKDGELVVIHDETVDRTTTGRGNVTSYSLEELSEFKLYNQNTVLTDEKIPTLKEVLIITRGKIYIDLDISKKVPFDRVFPIVKQYGMLDQVLFYSSKMDEIKEMIDTDSKVLAMPIINGYEKFDAYENIKNIKVVHYTDATFNKNLVDRATAKGWFIFKNAYVNSSNSPLDDNFSQALKIKSLGGKIVQTDYPILIQNYLKN